jgi:predicted small lipoprotein YifL
MLKVIKILVMAHALVGGAAMLNACGQKGPLISPSTPESAGRASLTETLTPWRAENANKKTEKMAPVPAPLGAPTATPLNAPAAPAAAPR